MRVLVYGGRDFTDRQAVYAALDALHRKHRITEIIHGGADGADTLGAEWGWERNVRIGTYNAKWQEHGKAAGPIRNQQMIDEGKPDAAVEFPGGRGTADMRSRVERAGVKLWQPMKGKVTV